MIQIKNILQQNSNEAIARISGYPVEQIKMLRKNDVDPFAIKMDSMNRPVPVKSIMEDIIEQRFNNHLKQIR